MRDMQSLLAWHASIVTRPHVKKAIDPRRLMGPEPGRASIHDFESVEDYVNHVRSLGKG